MTGIVLLVISIDSATEERIMRLFAEKLKGKTVASVLHRLETALQYDKILTREDGRVLHSNPRPWLFRNLSCSPRLEEGMLLDNHFGAQSPDIV